MDKKQSENSQSNGEIQYNGRIQLDNNKPKYIFYVILGILVAILLIGAILYFVFSKGTESSVFPFTELDEENNFDEESEVVEGFDTNGDEVVEDNISVDEVPEFS